MLNKFVRNRKISLVFTFEKVTIKIKKIHTQKILHSADDRVIFTVPCQYKRKLWPEEMILMI